MLPDPVGCRNCAHDQSVARRPNRLVVARIDLLQGRITRGNHSRQPRSWRDPHRMSPNDIPAWPMIDRRLQILHQRPVQPYVQALSAVANGQNRLMLAKSLLHQQFVHCRPDRVRLTALRHRIFAISLRVNINPAPRQQASLHPSKPPRHTFLSRAQRNDNRCCSGSAERCQIRRHRVLVVIRITAGRLGNGNMNAHISISLI